MNIQQLKDWLETLPKDMMDGSVCGIINSASFPLSAKRVVAYKFKDGSGCGIAVNPMGTHILDSFLSDVEIISIFQP